MEEKTFKQIFDDLCKMWTVIDKGYKHINVIQHPNRPIKLTSAGDLLNSKTVDLIWAFNTGKKYKYKVLPNNIVVDKEGVIAINLS